jgi:hypothetical protein
MLKVIAFFDLKDKTDPEDFLNWVRDRQAKVFDRKLKGVKDFKVYITVDSDGGTKLPRMVQIFDYFGTAEDWRNTLDEMRKTDDKEMAEIVSTWRKFCKDETTRIIYVDESKYKYSIIEKMEGK